MRIEYKTNNIFIRYKYVINNYVSLQCLHVLKGVALPWCVPTNEASNRSTNPGTQQFTNGSHLC